MKLPTIFYEQAVKSLRPNANWGNKNGELIYFDDDCPTDIEIEEKAKELQADYEASQYQRDRKYPNLGEQFDLLFKDINEGTLDKTGGFYTAIKSVKDAHPKPSE